MGFLSRLFGGKKETSTEEIQIVSRKPVGKFRVEKTFKILGKETLIGKVENGIIYPGYKLRGKEVAVIYKIEKERKTVDFAIDGDTVALILEGDLKAKPGEVLEIYQS
ncbi:tRNA-binding protein Pbp11 [Thermococcus piezophilus]|uniref:Translation factor n=1 Tax=Thermococcus piezophilus TaxID=1712654 RepID=A0A172WHK5_9EURY|nr:tRNA-binding protein Pbp11 [Thermococcus piezophilus]ANF22805.1 translation factor [Thermococcus piezophilus]